MQITACKDKALTKEIEVYNMLTFENGWSYKILTFPLMYCTPDSIYLDNFFTINYQEDEVFSILFLMQHGNYGQLDTFQ